MERTWQILNLSSHTGTVLLGAAEHKIEAGQKIVTKPPLEDTGMFRLMVSHAKNEGENVTCYDRQVSGSPDSRKILFLLPDETLGMKVSSLPIIGELE